MPTTFSSATSSARSHAHTAIFLSATALMSPALSAQDNTPEQTPTTDTPSLGVEGIKLTPPSYVTSLFSTEHPWKMNINLFANVENGEKSLRQTRGVLTYRTQRGLYSEDGEQDYRHAFKLVAKINWKKIDDVTYNTNSITASYGYIINPNKFVEINASYKQKPNVTESILNIGLGHEATFDNDQKEIRWTFGPGFISKHFETVEAHDDNRVALFASVDLARQLAGDKEVFSENAFSIDDAGNATADISAGIRVPVFEHLIASWRAVFERNETTGKNTTGGHFSLKLKFGNTPTPPAEIKTQDAPHIENDIDAQPEIYPEDIYARELAA